MKYLIILLSFIIGCSNRSEYLFDNINDPIIPNYKDKVIPVWVESGFSKEELIEINNAILEWNIAFNGVKVLSPVSWNLLRTENHLTSKDLLILRVSSTDPEFHNNYIQGMLGFANKDNDGKSYLYIISDRVNSDMMFGVILHELGHLFGAGHSETGLMTPYYSEDNVKCIDIETIIQVQTSMGFPDKTMISSCK